MSDFRRVRLAEVATIVTGATPSSSATEDWGDAIDFITPSDQIEGVREALPSRRLSLQGASKLAKRQVPAKSTNLTCIGSTIGKVSMATNPSVTNQQINSIVAIDGLLDTNYLYYMTKNWSRALKQDASGSATPIVNKSVLSTYEFDIPKLQHQKAIAEVLGALDDKIAVNSRLAHTADELQRTTFQSLLADAVQVPLSETAQFVNGKAFTKNASGSGRMVVRIAELNSSPGASTVYNDLEVDEKHLARPGDILFAWSGSLTLHRWSRDEAIVNQHIFKVIANPDYPPWLVFELIRHKLEEFRSVAADKATTMGHIQRRHLDEPVLVPLQAAIASYDALMAGLWDRALKANEENLALASLRDTLLPQLMSGKLRVEDAEKVVEEVV